MSFCEIEAWDRHACTRLSLWTLETIRLISAGFIAGSRDTDEGSAPPWMPPGAAERLAAQREAFERFKEKRGRR